MDVLAAIKDTIKNHIKCDLSFDSTLFQEPAIMDIMSSVSSEDTTALNASYFSRSTEQTPYMKKAAGKAIFFRYIFYV